MSESALVSACLMLLKAHRITAWRQNAGGFAIVQGGRRYFLRLGTEGMSDIGGILGGGGYLAVECKRPGNRLTKEQAAFLAMVNDKGGVGMVVWSAEQLERELKARGL